MSLSSYNSLFDRFRVCGSLMNESPKELLVWHGPKPAASDFNILKVAELMGVPARNQVWPQGNPDFCEVIEQHYLTGDYAFCISASTLLDICQLKTQQLLHFRGGKCIQLFAYGFGSNLRDSELISTLSQNRLNSVRNLDEQARKYSVLETDDSFCQEFAGLTFGPTNHENDVVFETSGHDERVKEFVTIGNRPFLVATENPNLSILFAGTREILDIDKPFPPGIRLLDTFSKLVPFMMFLRRVFGTRCWHGAQKLGSLIIDDPLLTRRYGFLRYDSLLDAMEQSQFATNLAFIPWNYRRSRKKVIDLFKRHPGRYSLSVHGCDHTKAEFATTDSATLRSKARAALHRMTAHEQLTGLPFDRVMVFPGGHFSSKAIEALKSSDYVAAVNSTEFATDLSDCGLRIRDVLDLAVMRYSNFPIFIRRYPRRIAEFALDLFLGRPALIVVHHEDFKNGYAEIQAFAEQLNSLAGGITWCSLEEIARRSYLIKRSSNNDMQVRLFTDHAIVENREPKTCSFKLWRALDEPAPVPQVIVNGKNVSATAAVNTLSVRFDLKPGDEAKVCLRPAEPVISGSLEAGSLLYRMNVRARRYLCEFRDNYVGPSRRLVSSG